MFGRTALRFLPALPVAFSYPALVLCEEPGTADRIRGNYENKIRFFAPPEKIFETFSSIKTDDKGVVMSYDNFFHSMTPYSYTASDEEANKYLETHSPEVLKLVDVNQDGLIDFPEFIFFITILQLPEGEVRNVFAKKGGEDHTLNKQQFAEELTNLRKCTLVGKKQQNKTLLDARHISSGEQEF